MTICEEALAAVERLSKVAATLSTIRDVSKYEYDNVVKAMNEAATKINVRPDL